MNGKTFIFLFNKIKKMFILVASQAGFLIEPQTYGLFDNRYQTLTI